MQKCMLLCLSHELCFSSPGFAPQGFSTPPPRGKSAVRALCPQAEQRTRAKGMGGFFSGELEKVRSRISEAEQETNYAAVMSSHDVNLARSKRAFECGRVFENVRLTAHAFENAHSRTHCVRTGFDRGACAFECVQGTTCAFLGSGTAIQGIHCSVPRPGKEAIGCSRHEQNSNPYV